MELVLTSENVEPLPREKEAIIINPSNFLNSPYKNVVKLNYKESKKNSVYYKRQQIKSHFLVSSCVAETTLKISLFLAVFLLIFS